MKVTFKELNMEFDHSEGTLAGEFFEKVLEADKRVNVGIEAVQPMIPLSNEVVLKQQEQFKLSIQSKDKTIADLTNRLNQATSNYENTKEAYNKLKADTADKKDWERQDELDEAYVKIKNQQAEINSLMAKVKELETQPNMYSTGMADALKSGGLITEEEHEEAVNRASLGRKVTTYWDNFETYVDNFVPAPLLVTDFGTFNVVNCTPHPVTLAGKSGTITIGPSEVCTRLEMNHQEAELPGSDLSLVVESKGKLINVPMRQPRTLYVVSRIVFDVSIDREDFICPNTIRANKQNGQVVSVPNFICRKELILKAQEENKNK